MSLRVEMDRAERTLNRHRAKESNDDPYMYR